MIAEVMRELQARHNYLYVAGRLGSTGEYINWSRKYEPPYDDVFAFTCSCEDGTCSSTTVCPPPFPSDTWYIDEFRSLDDPQDKARAMTQQLIRIFAEHAASFVHDRYKDLEDKPDYDNEFGCDVPSNFKNAFIGSLSLPQSFPALCEFITPPPPDPSYYAFITVTTSNYRSILEVLKTSYLPRLHVLSAGAEIVKGEKNNGWEASPVSCEEAIAGAGLDGWDGGPIGRMNLGVREYTHFYVYFVAGREIYPGYFSCDLTNYPGGSARFYLWLTLTISDDPSDGFDHFSNYSQYGLQPKELGQCWADNIPTRKPWESPTLAHIEPDFSTNCPDLPENAPGGWKCGKRVILVDCEFDTDEQGIDTVPFPAERIYKDRTPTTVYSGAVDCPNEDIGETVCTTIYAPWGPLELNQYADKLIAKVIVDGNTNPDAGALIVPRRTLRDSNDAICFNTSEMYVVPTGAHNQGKYAFDIAVQAFKGETDLSFTITFWRQYGTPGDLTTIKSEKSFAFQVRENKFTCCARPDDCEEDGTCTIPLELEPEIQMHENGDVEVYFFDVDQAYILVHTRDGRSSPAFLEGLFLEQYDGTPHLELTRPGDTPPTFVCESHVCLRMQRSLGLIYEVPATWWDAVEPVGPGTFKYLVDAPVRDQQTGNVSCMIIAEMRDISDPPDGKDELVYYDEEGNIIAQRGDYTYDSGGRLTGFTDTADGESRSTTITYDANGNVTSVTGSGCSSCGSGGGLDVQYTYNSNGRLQQIKNVAGTVLYEYAYDTAGEVAVRYFGEASGGIPLQIFERQNNSLGIVTDIYDYIDAFNYRVTRRTEDSRGRAIMSVEYENLNENPDNPQGRYFISTTHYWPCHDGDRNLLGLWCFDEGYGGWALDATPNGHDGLLRNYSSQSERWVTGLNSGGALRFTRDNSQYVEVKELGTLDNSHGYTLCAWVKPVTVNQCGIVSIREPSGSDNICLGIKTSGYPHLTIGGYSCMMNTSVGTGTWKFIAATFDPTATQDNVNVYLITQSGINRSVATFAAIPTIDDAYLVLGATTATSEHFNGYLDNVMIYGEVLSSEQLKILHDFQKGLPYVEIVTHIQPMGYGKKNGRRTETCNHYAYATDKTPYLTKTEVIRYDDANVAYKQSITDYEVIEVSGKYMGTRIISNTTNIQKGTDVGATTVYQYKGATDRQYETVIEPQVIPVAREGQSNGPVQLKRYYEYDNQGRIKLEKTYTGESPATYIAATHYEYTHAGGHLTKQYSVSSQSPAEQLDVTEWRYNGFGEIYLTKSPDGVVSGKTYDASGRLASEFILNDPSLYTTFTTYATLKSAISQATLDQRPRVISLTHYYYDSNNRLEYVKQAKADYSFPYCLPEETADNVTWVVTQYSYDTYGRKTETIQDATGVALTTTYVYDNLGRLEKTILPNKKYTKTERNGRGLTKRQIVGYMSGTSEVPVAVTEFKYDANGNVIEEKFPDGTRIQKQYDDLDRLKKVYKGVIAN